MKAAIYARVSTLDQEPENQLQELRRYVEARGWTATEYVDRGVSGAKDRRPALDRLLADARRRRFDVVVKHHRCVRQCQIDWRGDVCVLKTADVDLSVLQRRENPTVGQEGEER
jgi:DNA invertase Pin-like site-specific DNA recombinase